MKVTVQEGSGIRSSWEMKRMAKIFDVFMCFTFSGVFMIFLQHLNKVYGAHYQEWFCIFFLTVRERELP